MKSKRIWTKWIIDLENQQIIKKPDDEDYFDLSSEEDDYSIKTKKTNSNPHSFKEEEGKMRSGSLTPPETPTYSLTGGGGRFNFYILSTQ